MRLKWTLWLIKITVLVKVFQIIKPERKFLSDKTFEDKSMSILQIAKFVSDKSFMNDGLAIEEKLACVGIYDKLSYQSRGGGNNVAISGGGGGMRLKLYKKIQLYFWVKVILFIK